MQRNGGDPNNEAVQPAGALAQESSLERQIDEESIILLKERPVFAIKNGAAELKFIDDDDRARWKLPLEGAASRLSAAINSIGRIELRNHAMSWVGTGWIVDDGILVTNRHVAKLFAERRGAGFGFKETFAGKVLASVDFLQEIGSTTADVIELSHVMHIEPEGGPDVAFFRVVANGRPLSPIALASGPPSAESAQIATIGYPASDPRIPEPEHMKRIFQDTYNKKRLAPGTIMSLTDEHLEHDCTTLGGNSGSAVIDLATGAAVGLHFSGTYRDRNFAVRADVVRRILDEVKQGRRRIDPVRREQPPVRGVAAAVPAGRAAEGTTMTVTIPVTLTITVGGPQQGAVVNVPVAPSDVPDAEHDPDDTDDEVDTGHEAAPSDYADRRGYQVRFLEDHQKKLVPVDLPMVVAAEDDVLRLASGGTELRYENFTVVMSKRRRMCFFSACNIDGGLAKKAGRVKWKLDPRLPKDAQIMGECYGNPPKFSRGHMTRREDPGWGATRELARRGNEDSMHVTNAVPQMQAFNSPIWLGLEDYALGHTIEDRMKVCVFTGPYFHDDDPVKYGVKIPIGFWKILAFIHDDTGRLCATGYEMSQEQNLESGQEFVFADYRSSQLGITTQVPIQAIEMRSGIQFGRLHEVDPLRDGNESAGGGARLRLDGFNQIKFR
ncbi:MAG: DNA/RNA non-specific endonuclease [Deltaproteobacteria bacterium]|nr:DNA/RNA non-specific endonuclease [Deltaproteobacteria bacterium]